MVGLRLDPAGCHLFGLKPETDGGPEQAGAAGSLVTAAAAANGAGHGSHQT